MTLRTTLTIGISILLLMTISCEWESYVEPPPKVVRDTTLRVPGQYETIQAALDASIDGDEIVVASGTYSGTGNRDINFDNKAVTLRSEKGPDSTIINCENRRGFIFRNGETNASVVRGFKVFNGKADDGSLRGPWGGALFVENSAPLFINCIFEKNDATYGGAVACRTSSPAFDSCVFIDNDAIKDGGAIKAEGGAEPKLWNCTFTTNTAAERGGAIDCTNAAPTCTNTVFIGNTASSPGFGGGIFCNSSSPLLKNCIFFDNSSVDGAGMHCVDGSNPTIENCSFVKNAASGESGAAGMSCDDSAPFVNYCLFADNTNGRAVFVSDELTVPTLKCCNIFDNADGDWVGPIASQASLRGNFSADPLFCDASIDERLRLTSESPCLPDNNNCSRHVGAFVEICE